jgi:Tfp pilus assembly protein PilF
VAAGREALKNGDYGQARMEFIEAVAMAPNSADANHGLAFAAHKQGDIGTAIRYYCTASRLASPGSSIAREITSSLSNIGAVCE